MISCDQCGYKVGSNRLLRLHHNSAHQREANERVKHSMADQQYFDKQKQNIFEEEKYSYKRKLEFDFFGQDSANKKTSMTFESAKSERDDLKNKMNDEQGKGKAKFDAVLGSFQLLKPSSPSPASRSRDREDQIRRSRMSSSSTSVVSDVLLDDLYLSDSDCDDSP